MEFYTGCIVKVIDEHHPMEGRYGQITSPAMWSKPIYKKIPEGCYRVEFDSGDGRYYGDYHETQLEMVKEPGKARIKS